MLNSLLSSCGDQYSHKYFRLLVRNLIEEVAKWQDRPTHSFIGRTSVAANIARLETHHNHNRPENLRNSFAVFVHLTVRERQRSRNTRRVPVRGDFFRLLSHKSEFTDHVELIIVCCDK